MNNNLTLSVKLTGDGSQLSGTLRDAQGDVRAFGGTTERESGRAEQALERTGREAQTVSGHLNKLRNIALGVGAGLAAMGGMSFVRGMLDESQQLETNLLRTQQLIETTGRTATRSAAGMHEQARSIALATLQSTEGVMQAQQTLLTFRNITGETFDQTIDGAVDLASAMNTDLNSAVLQLGKALEDPVTGMSALTRSGTVFTESQKEMVKELVETNRTAEAQAFILGELAAQYGGVAEKEAEGFGGAQDTLGQKVQEAKIELADQLNLVERSSNFYNTAAAGVQNLTDNMGLAVDITKGLATVAGTTAVVALGRYTAAQVTANAAMFTGAGAARALTGAMTLLGGPIGLLVGAGGLLYMFREEVGLVDVAAQNATRALDANSDAIRGGTAAALDATYDNLISSLEAVSLQAQEAMSQMAELEARQAFYESSHKGVADSVSGAIDQQAQALAGLWERQVELQSAIRKNREARESGTNADRESTLVLKTLDEWLFKTTQSTESNAAASREAATAARELAKSTQGQADALEDLYDRLIPGRRETVQLARDIQTLNLAIAMGTGNIAQNIQMMGLLQQQFIEAQNDTDDLAKKTVDAAFTMEGTWDEVRLNGLRRLDDGFADLWQGAVDGSLNATDIMKRALDQTLAEMAHMAFTRPITVQMATSMGFGGTGGGQQAGGGAQSFGGMMDGSGAIANAYRAFQGTGSTYAGTFGSELAVQTQGGLKAGFESFANSGFGNTALGLGGGFVGTKLGGSVFGESQEQQIGATVGGIAGQVLIPIPGLGAGIGSFLGSGLGSLFGSEPTKFSGRFGTTASLDRSEGAGNDGVFEHQDSGRFYRETALGYAGFRDQGTERLQRAGIGEDKQWAEDLVNATAAMDGLTVSVARSDQEIATMRDTVQGLEASGRNAGEIIEFALKGRALAALESIGHTFSDAITSLPAEEFTARMELMVGGIGTLMQSADRLNLQFDATASGALEAAGNLAQIVGGVDNLAAINQGYYQATYSETERLSRSQAELRESLSSVTDQVPNTVGELRALVEAQNLNDAASGELAVRLMELAPALKQTNDAVRDAIEQQYQESVGQAPAAEKLEHWFNQVASGSLTLERALSQIANSTEATAASLGVYQTLNEELMIASGAWDQSTLSILDANAAMQTLNMSGKSYIDAINELSSKDARALRDYASDMGLSFKEIQAVIADIISGNDALAGSGTGGSGGGSSPQTYEQAQQALENARGTLETGFGDLIEDAFGGVIPTLNQALAALDIEMPEIDTSAFDAAVSSAQAMEEALASVSGLGSDRQSFVATAQDVLAGLNADNIGDALSEIRTAYEDAVISGLQSGGGAVSASDVSGEIEQSVFQAYENVLNRAPDVEGFEWWVGEIESGAASLNDLINGMRNSAEFDLQDVYRDVEDQLRAAQSAAADIQDGEFGGEYSGFFDALQGLIDARNALDGIEPPSSTPEPSSPSNPGRTGPSDEERTYERLIQREMELRGDVAGLRQIELATMSASNAVVQQRIYAIQDEMAAQQLINTAAQSATPSAYAADTLSDALETLSFTGETTASNILAVVGALDADDLADRLNTIGLSSDEVSTALGTLAEEMQRAADVYGQRVSLEQQIADLTGDTAAKEQFLAESRALELAGMDESLHSLQERYWALQDEAKATEEAKRSQQGYIDAIKSAYQAVEQAVEAEREIVQSAYDATRDGIQRNMDSISTSLRDTEQAASSLQSALDSMIDAGGGAQMLRKEGQETLKQILASGGIGDSDELSRALSAVTEPSEGLFGSYVDYQRDFWQTANVVDQLHDRADEQLTTGEQSLAALERQLTLAEYQHRDEMRALDATLTAQQELIAAEHGQLEWLDRLNNSVLTIPEAIAQLSNALSQASNVENAPGGSSQPSNPGGGGGSSAPKYDTSYYVPGEKIDSSIGAYKTLYASLNGVHSSDYQAALDYMKVDNIKDALGLIGAGSLTDVDDLLGFDGSHEDGLWSVPFDNYRANLHVGETVLPADAAAAFRNFSSVSNPPSNRGDNAMLRELQRLNAKVERLEAELREGNAISRGIANHTSKGAREQERMRRSAQEAENA